MDYKKTNYEEKIKKMEENGKRLKIGTNPGDFKNYADSFIFNKGGNIANFIRILMKEPVDYFFGIYEIKLFGKLGQIMLRFNFNLDKLDDICVVSQNKVLAGLKCYEAISFADGREIFFWKNSELISLNDKNCVTIERGQNLGLGECGRKDENAKWTYNEIDKVITKAGDKEKCLVFNENFEILKRKDVDIMASSTMSDDQHEAQNVFYRGDNEKMYWASSPGDRNVEIFIKFGNQPLNSVTIYWLSPVKRFNLYILMEDVWRKYVEVNNNMNLMNNYKLHGSLIQGIKLLMIDSDYLFNDVVYFAIKKIEIESGYRKLKLDNCLEAQKRNSTWEVSQIDVSDFSRSKELEFEKKRIANLGKEIIEKRKELGLLRPQLDLYFAKATECRNEIASIQKNLTENYNTIKSYSDFNLKNEVLLKFITLLK